MGNARFELAFETPKAPRMDQATPISQLLIKFDNNLYKSMRLLLVMKELIFILLLPIFMISLFSGIWLYGTFGPHTIYNDTIVVKTPALEDGDPMLMTTDGKYYSFHTSDLTWKKFLLMKFNDTLNVTISQNVFGDRSIIKINE